MTAVIAGLITALAWAFATLASSRASRRIGGPSSMALVSLVGLVASLPLLLSDRLPSADDGPDLVWVALTGFGYGAGLLLLYSAYTHGKVSVVAPIASTEGALAAAIAIVAGEQATALLVLALVVTAAGIVLTTLEAGTSASDLRVGGGGYVLLAAIAVLCFGASLYAAGRVSDAVPIGWVVVAGRIVGVLFVALPLVLLRRLRIDRAAAPLVVAAGLLEVVGYLAFVWGAREGIAVTAVLASQFAVIVALLSHRMGDRLATRQWVGIAIAGAGVAAVTLLRL